MMNSFTTDTLIHWGLFRVSAIMKVFYLEGFAGDQLINDQWYVEGLSETVQHQPLHNLTLKAPWHFRLGLYLCRFYSDTLNATAHHFCLYKPVLGSEEQGICVLLVSVSFDTTPVHINSTQNYIASSNL